MARGGGGGRGGGGRGGRGGGGGGGGVGEGGRGGGDTSELPDTCNAQSKTCLHFVTISSIVIKNMRRGSLGVSPRYCYQA